MTLVLNDGAFRKMGQAGRRKAIQEYSEDVYYRRLMAVYKKAIEVNRQANNSGPAKPIPTVKAERHVYTGINSGL